MVVMESASLVNKAFLYVSNENLNSNEKKIKLIKLYNYLRAYLDQKEILAHLGNQVSLFLQSLDSYCPKSLNIAL